MKTGAGIAGLPALPSVRSANRVITLSDNLEKALVAINGDSTLTQAKKIVKAQAAGAKTRSAINAALGHDRTMINAELVTLAGTLKSNQLRSRELTQAEIVMLPATFQKFQDSKSLTGATDVYLRSLLELGKQGLVDAPETLINNIHSPETISKMDVLMEADSFISNTVKSVDSFVTNELRQNDAGLISKNEYTDLEVE